MLNRYLDIAPEVKKALDEGKPVVALESTIISHGMPYPQNKETALKVEEIIRSASKHAESCRKNSHSETTGGRK